MSAKKAANTKIELSVAATDTDAGIMWLGGLGEPKFRDSILNELFRKMGERKEIEWFENIHGRLDKGVDYILTTQTALERKVLGIQVKGKPITRTGGNGSLSAVEIASECESAMKHEFQVQGTKRRLDSIAVWSSAHITPDAEEEFTKSGLAYRIQIKKPREIFSLIEEFAPSLLGNVPQLAVVRYINERADPEPESVRVFGCEINPKIHFLEPELSEFAPASVEGLKKENGHIRRKKTTATLEKVLDDSRHTTLFAGELSGKSYLLKRCMAVLAERKKLSILLEASQLTEVPRSPEKLAASVLKFFSPPEAEAFARGAGMVFLIDDIHKIPQTVREWLFTLDPKHFRIIATGSSILVPQNVASLHITGTKLGSLPKFLRSLNVKHSKAFLDRAQSFIERTLATSRLPTNAFTISIMLQECQHGGSKFSTPTMGRVIERFVELQLGSHSEETFVVDFETKRDFLSHLAGKTDLEYSLEEFKRRLAKFIEAIKHPQSVEDFVQDFRRSGVFSFGENKIRWAHPAFLQYFWVRNLVSNGKYKPIAGALCKKFNPTLAALAGSQAKSKDISELIQPLMDEISKTPLPSLKSLVPDIDLNRAISAVISDEEEDAMLSDLECSDQNLDSKAKHPLARIAKSTMFGGSQGEEDEGEAKPENVPQIDEKTKKLIRRHIMSWLEEISQSRLEFAFNLAAVLMNARKAKYELKQRGLEIVLQKSQDFGNILTKFFAILLPDKKSLAFDVGWSALYAKLHMADRMVGDPFLLNVLREMKKKAKSQDDKLQILDLLLCCGDDVGDEIVATLKSINRLDVTFAVYVRIVGIYYFRFHHSADKDSLRALLKNIRISERNPILPKV